MEFFVFLLGFSIDVMLVFERLFYSFSWVMVNRYFGMFTGLELGKEVKLIILCFDIDVERWGCLGWVDLFLSV